MSDDKYKDIIDMPHRESPFHRRMPAIERAAQFSPFAALTGYEEAVTESARLTDARPELSDDKKEEISRILTGIMSEPEEKREINMTVFIQDELKEGGRLEEITAGIKRIDETEGKIILSRGGEIMIEDIVNISE